jgi:DNA-binding CsgD family transcriptional regulator
VSEEVMLAKARGKEPRASMATGKAERPLANLTDTELELMELLGEGKSDEEIARQTGTRANKLRGEYSQLQKKLKLNSYNALIRYAVCWVEGGTGEE